MQLCGQEKPNAFWSLQTKTNSAGAMPLGLLLSAIYPYYAYMDESCGMVLVVFGVPQRHWSPDTFKSNYKNKGMWVRVFPS